MEEAAYDISQQANPSKLDLDRCTCGWSTRGVTSNDVSAKVDIDVDATMQVHIQVSTSPTRSCVKTQSAINWQLFPSLYSRCLFSQPLPRAHLALLDLAVPPALTTIAWNTATVDQEALHIRETL